MKFSSPVHAADGHPSGLTSYAKVKRVRPFHVLLNIFEGGLGLLGVVLIIMVIWHGSFEKAGAAADHGMAWVFHSLHNLIQPGQK